MGRVGGERKGEGRKEQETEGEKEKALLYLILFTWVQKEICQLFSFWGEANFFFLAANFRRKFFTMNWVTEMAVLWGHYLQQ